MRQLFVALMIVLLPLRGWLGDAMATQMAVPAMAVAAVAAVAATHCGDLAGSQHSLPSDASHCQDCVACQACHAVGLTALLPEPTQMLAALLKPHAAAPRFASAERAPGLKPPIS